MSRRFIKEEVIHTYQRSESGFNIFYEVEDYLVYYTIFSILAGRYNIVVYGLCLMIDHLHSLISASTSRDFTTFVNEVTSCFVREYNQEHKRSGPLFCKSFGSALKLGLKRLRTAISYLYNNPVERQLCRYAQEYRWNFLAYALSSHPFSEKLDLRSASRSLRRVLKEVDGTHARKRYLSYTQLKRMFASLDKGDKARLIDYIIVRYSVIRYDLLTKSCYDGVENMLVAINSNAGSEYDIKEVKWTRSDAEYRKLHRYVRDRGYASAGDIIGESQEKKNALLNGMLKDTDVPRFQIYKFLHMESCGT